MYVPDFVLQGLGIFLILFVFAFVGLGLHLSKRFGKHLKLRAIRSRYMVESDPVDLFKRP